MVKPCVEKKQENIAQPQPVSPAAAGNESDAHSQPCDGNEATTPDSRKFPGLTSEEIFSITDKEPHSKDAGATTKPPHVAVNREVLSSNASTKVDELLEEKENTITKDKDISEQSVVNNAAVEQPSFGSAEEEETRDATIESVVTAVLSKEEPALDQLASVAGTGKLAPTAKFVKRGEKRDQLRTEKGHFQCDDQTWENKFALLQQFRHDNRHCIVPRNHPEIGDWASRQRRMYKLKQIAPERKHRLDELGFSWDRDSERWDEHFLELLEFKQVRGHCLVPRRYRENMKLARWVEAQRNYYNNDRSKISQERIERLNNAGFAWSDNNKTDWDVRFHELVQYKDKHGDTLVPQRDDKIGALGNWVVAQRYHYKKRNKRLTEDRIAKLNSIGFVWDASNRNCCAAGFKRKAKDDGACSVSLLEVDNLLKKHLTRIS